MTGELYVPAGTTADANHVSDIAPERAGRTHSSLREKFPLPGGRSVRGSVTDLAHTPVDARAQIASGAGGRFALAGAKCERQLPARYGPAPEVPIDERPRVRARPASSRSSVPQTPLPTEGYR